VRIAIIIALLVSLGVLGAYGKRFIEPVAPAQPTRQAAQLPPPPAVEPDQGQVAYYPEVPQQLPDLNTGYLFTETRSVGGDAEGAGNGAEKIGEPEVDINSVVFIGSIITKDIRKAIISAPPAKESQPKVYVKAGKLFKRAAMAAAKPQEYVKVVQGETFRGYTVKLVSPDKITFVRGEEVVEKLLYDPAKKRATGGPPMSMPRGQNQQSGGGPGNIVAEPQQPTATMTRRSHRNPPVPEGSGEEGQGILLERPPR